MFLRRQVKADMENVKVVFKNVADTVYEATPLNFRFIRERYTPYTQCSGTVIADFELAAVCSVELYYNNTLLHRGMADDLSKTFKDGRCFISFLSRGYTMLLGQNEPEPGLIADSNLSSLMNSNTAIPNVQWQSDTENVGYIFVKEKSTIWDAVCAYAYKAYKNYPFITDTNTVSVSLPKVETRINYNNETIVSMGETVSTSGIISRVYMKDINDEYSYSRDNSISSQYNIVREKYYALDQQWLASPDDGLQSKLRYSDKARNAVYITYVGHKFENLMNRAIYNLDGVGFMQAEYISGVIFYGNKNGVFTKITVYRDSYA